MLELSAILPQNCRPWLSIGTIRSSSTKLFSYAEKPNKISQYCTEENVSRAARKEAMASNEKVGAEVKSKLPLLLPFNSFPPRKE